MAEYWEYNEGKVGREKGNDEQQFEKEQEKSGKVVINRRKGKDGETEEGAAKCAYKEKTKHNKEKKLFYYLWFI
jgi:hypothetical protein